ncbi:hypothetical protein AB0K60_21295 [Thermopolyspora sp. NPDC052614]|uniref:hypothetical protein n=1 Tax=Thermopolyspora sp. NPDC052614 TaxID=3155682 RepID=UPI003412121A
MSVLEKLAETLDVPLSELAAEAPVVAASAEEMPQTAGLRLVLSGAHSLQAMLHSAPVPPTDQLRSGVERAWMSLWGGLTLQRAVARESRPGPDAVSALVGASMSLCMSDGLGVQPRSSAMSSGSGYDGHGTLARAGRCCRCTKSPERRSARGISSG